MDPAVVDKLFYENRKIIEKEIKMRTNDLINSGRFCFNDYDDIAQELRVEIFKSLVRYDKSKSKISSYVQSVAKKKGVDLLRKRKAKRRDCEAEISIEEIYDKMEFGKVDNFSEFFLFKVNDGRLLSDVNLSISELPKNLRKICSLLMEDYNISEIAKILNKNRRTINKLVDKIRQDLKFH